MAGGQKRASICRGWSGDRGGRSMQGMCACGAGRLVVGERPRRFRRWKWGRVRGLAVWQIEAPGKGERRAKQKVVKRGVDAVVEPDDSQRGVVSCASTRGGEWIQR
eukprot:2067008-Pleurochrysis_carterae.AAC.2